MAQRVSPDAIWKKIEAEIGGNWSRSNLHNVDLRKCLLLQPVRMEYENSWYRWAGRTDPGNRVLSSRVLQLWLVLEEDPISKKGYSIVYDEDADLFGLANGGIFIAHYGSFIETFEAM